MSNDENFYQDETPPAQADRPPEPGGTGCGTKLLIGCLVVCGGVALVCCGGFAFLFVQITDGVKQTPQEVTAVTKEIAAIDIPENFDPQTALKLELFGVRVSAAFYTIEDSNGILMLMETNLQGKGPDADLRRALRQQEEFGERHLDVKDVETREFEIRGETVEFEFAKAEDAAGTAFRQVTGDFPGKNGAAMLLLQIEEERYDEAVVTELIESIH